MTKYTTEAVRKELRAAIPENLYISNLVLDNLVRVFTAQQQALLDEVEKRLQSKYEVDETSGGSVNEQRKSHNATIDRVTEILKQLIKEIV